MPNTYIQQPSQQQTQLQTQQLSPSQLQGLNLLSAPIMELEHILSAELENNPLLENTAPVREELCGDTFSDAHLSINTPDLSEFDGDREDFPLLNSLAGQSDDFESNWNENAENIQQRRDFMFDSLTTAPTLQDILAEQLQFCTLSPRERQAAELITGSLDERGFLTTHPADLAMSEDFSMEEIAKAIELVQSFDPPGVGAQDAAESLMLQLKRRNYPDLRIYTLLKDHQEELLRNQLPQIAKAMKITLDDIYKFLEDLKKLNCIPAAGLNSSTVNQTVLPEMSIEVVDNKIIVNGREGAIPRLGIVKSYLKMLEDPLTPEDTRKYLKEKLASAESLIKSLVLRQDTISRITGVIARKQADYFKNGLDSLHPMTMQEVAQELNLHETTVSRAVAGKYLDTPQGLTEYKFFFSGGFTTTEGEEVSSRRVKEMIKSFIADENPAKPLSDAVISQMLSDSGVNVARRTVAKYRESLNIPPTNLRRKH